jgi:hypothetical protein
MLVIMGLVPSVGVEAVSGTVALVAGFAQAVGVC